MTSGLHISSRMVLSATVALAACGRSNASSTSALAHDSAGGNVDAVPAAVATAQGPRDTVHLASNHMGRIPVLEYHIIEDKESLYQVTREHFRKDLQMAYDRGYRPITISQMLDKDFSMVPA